jgi:hypothetical protein
MLRRIFLFLTPEKREEKPESGIESCRELDHALDQSRLVCPKSGERRTRSQRLSSLLPVRRVTMANQRGIKAGISLSGFDN